MKLRHISTSWSALNILKSGILIIYQPVPLLLCFALNTGYFEILCLKQQVELLSLSFCSAALCPTIGEIFLFISQEMLSTNLNRPTLVDHYPQSAFTF